MSIAYCKYFLKNVTALFVELGSSKAEKCELDSFFM